MRQNYSRLALTLLVIASLFPAGMTAQGNRQVDMGNVVADFERHLETIPFYASSAIADEEQLTIQHITNLKNWKDKEAYVSHHQLNSYVTAQRDSLTLYGQGISSLINSFLSRYHGQTIADQSACIDSLQAIATQRISYREKLLNQLDSELRQEGSAADNTSTPASTLVWLAVAVLAVLAAVGFFLAKARKSRSHTSAFPSAPTTPQPRQSANPSPIIVRRKTAAILRRQSLEDVMGNPAYLQINCDEFCQDSAVRRIYIKDSCAHDIFEIYANDLRQSPTPCENGCMVLGRWVHDTESNEYYVSLEHVVTPGDDAVFSEYELNFGGKIKLRVTEMLRRLRRETNLQYDLTCWVHSHPGLGVFFSNADSGVHQQLAHPQHPRFLTAIVIDILTPGQQLGIFTYRNDGTLNAKTDLVKLYSLHEFNKWAVESLSKSSTHNLPDNHFNTLLNARHHLNPCHAINLSPTAVLDITVLAATHNSPLAGVVRGYTLQQVGQTSFQVQSVTKQPAPALNDTDNNNDNDNPVVGAFIVSTQRDTASLKKIISPPNLPSPHASLIRFLLVYTPADGLLTSIPVCNGEIASDENLYGQQQLEELTLWSRTKN